MTSGDRPAGNQTAPEPEDEQHRKFREALERKKSSSTGSGGAAADGGRTGVGPGSGPKAQRMFRRKSGG